MRDEVNHFYEFGPFRLNVRKRLLLRGGEIVPLAPKAIDLLVALVENGGEVLSKDELMKRVWSDTFVEEANLSHHIFSLRKALGEDKNGAKFIETIPRRGYRFAASVSQWRDEDADLVVAEHNRSRLVIEENITSFTAENDWTGHGTTEKALTPSQQPEGESKRKLPSLIFISCAILIAIGVALYIWISGKTKAEPTGMKTIAVLPFKPLVAESRDEALEMGMADTLIMKLASIKQIFVRPMSAVRIYTDLQQDAVEAGRELQVESVLDGSIQRLGDRLRVNVRLMRVKDGRTLWADKFDEKFTDLFDVQDRISERLSSALVLKLNAEEKTLLARRYTDNSEAYQLYTLGRYFWSKFTEDGLRKSIGLFEQAIEKDPQYALAYVGLCNAYMVLGVNGYISPKEARPKSKFAAEKALELDNQLAWGHQALGGFKLFHEWDWAGAEREFKRAMELDPGLAEPHELYGYLLSSLGRFDEALAELSKAQELNPVSVNIRSDYADAFRQARRCDEAIEALNKTLEMEPRNGFLHFFLGLTYAQKGLYEKALAEMNEAVNLSDRNTRILSGLGQVYALSGKKAEARKVISELQEGSKQRYVSPLYIAMVYATLEENDQAFFWLEKAYDDRACWLIDLGIEQYWDNLRPDPRFTDLLRRVGLPQSAAAGKF